jgi:hypothetical protein
MYRRNSLLSASISSWTSWTSGNVQNHAVPNTSFGLSNSNPGRVGEVALAREVLTSRRNSLFIVDPNSEDASINGLMCAMPTSRWNLGRRRAHLIPDWLAFFDKGSLDFFWIYGGQAIEGSYPCTVPEQRLSAVNSVA